MKVLVVVVSRVRSGGGDAGFGGLNAAYEEEMPRNCAEMPLDLVRLGG
jgi:hypothetical protein